MTESLHVTKQHAIKILDFDLIDFKFRSLADLEG